MPEYGLPVLIDLGRPPELALHGRCHGTVPRSSAATMRSVTSW